MAAGSYGLNDIVKPKFISGQMYYCQTLCRKL